MPRDCRNPKPRPARPSSIMAQVAGSGTAVTGGTPFVAKFMTPNSPSLSPLIPSVRRGCRGSRCWAHSRLRGPRAARCIAAPGINQDGTVPRTCCRIENVYAGVDKAKIADQQVARERTNSRWRNSKPPWRSEAAADDEGRVWLRTSIQIKDRHGTRPEGGILLSHTLRPERTSHRRSH
jgi:hypothetical protein